MKSGDPTDSAPALDQSAEPGVWRFGLAERASVIVDAEGYFAHMQQAMLNARRRIMLVGWDFDTRIHLSQGRRWYERPADNSYPERLGSFLSWLVRHRDELEIRVLKWGLSFFQLGARGSMLVDLLRMWPKKRITFKFDTQHPVGCTHHQKLAVLDEKLAVCGGIDLTHDRWDTREHKEIDSRRRRPRGKTYGPWHDITFMMEGPIAGELSDLCRARWQRAGAGKLEDLEPAEKSLWPEKLSVDFEDVEIGIARTRAEYEDTSPICEIETLMLDQIAAAERFIYIENQYFTSRKIADAIIKRLEEENPPEIVLVHPQHAEGWLERQAMDHARSALVRLIGEADKHNRFRVYVAWTGDTPIYIHAKLMIVDDRILRIGSANLNNRSMGLDSECDVFIDCDREANRGKGFEETIRDLRTSLLAEHCGVGEGTMAQLVESLGSMHKAIERFGADGVRALRPFELPELGDTEEALAGSQFFDPEHPDDMFEPFAHGGLFREGSRLGRLRDKLKRKSG
ncbi:phospholipase D-like domain-containing protein [Qipengyuania sp. DSG2-2]|uniref:phospholipase D-like domain-containing protein n=1 Tax=Qipengyuania sp. DGS2-2 TaxID=3349631 RepID=UPI0036D31C8F